MRTQHAGEHPSNRLSSGGVTSFEEALDLVEEALDTEAARMPRGVHAQPDREAMAAGHAQIKAALGRACSVWRQEQEQAERRTVDRLHADALAAEAALDDEASRWLGLLAQALESGDYSGLAI